VAELQGKKRTENGVPAVECLDNKIGESLDAGLKRVGLTAREIQVLRHLALGKGDKKISVDLLISVKTVNHHVSNIILKLDAKNRTHAVAKALLTRQIAMRASDVPAAIFNRRVNDQDKAVLGCRTSGSVEAALPRHHEERVKSESAI
jgi:DNA-binding CsgD family transcriptional regulator